MFLRVFDGFFGSFDEFYHFVFILIIKKLGQFEKIALGAPTVCAKIKTNLL
jgi:hypothetical protein